ncbi:sulfur carrier protein ThiS [Mangrovivirga sp. M17]|uniref:Sulfur carrier protein ThiS n=1 Tax=Mangrovivirga halotolerans TaxID=2993936 RepID=A0ABT3RUU8_9BACT|nr:sulfur carrier protein ThiS [Mangrovivirga halotolerans]MCX2745544.1 sulfur carrier protein ThiS [Mangrovivirga halotolerans]
MDFRINSEKHSTSEKELSLDQALKINGFTSRNGVAVALNNQVIPHGQWQCTQVNDGDNILVITATQGG